MREHARLVIIGAGIVGCSTAYHLSRLGWRDMVVVDQGPLFATGGSTSHAPGLVFQTNFSRMMTALAQYTVEFYSRLDLDGQPCFHPVGSLEVACTPQRLEDLKRKAGAAKSWGVEAGLLTPTAAREKLPLLDAGQILGAYWVPGDGIAKAVRACQAMAGEAQAHGAVFYSHTPVIGIEIKEGQVRAVFTPQGRIAAEKVLICAGIWGPRLGRLAGISIPLAPVQHQYALTAPLPELEGEQREVAHPILRHQDRAMYFRQQADCYGIGSYQHEPLLVDPESLTPESAIREFTPEHFGPAHRAAAQLLPALGKAELTYRINGMFSFTPDGLPLLGESQVRGLWVAEAVWITHAGGVGRAMAQWMAQGAPDLDLREADLNRFPPHAHTPAYLRARAAQQYREVYDIIHPLQQMEHPRPIRLTPLYPRLREQGAFFFENAGWERPQWFEANSALGDPPGGSRSGWEARHWSPIQGLEHRAARQGAALFDLSPFTQIEVKGPGALDFLQHLAANQLDQPVGRIVYTSLLDHRGGIRADLTITRLGPERFLVITGVATGPRDWAWLQQQVPMDGSVQLADLTSARCGLGLWGPKARQVLQQVCSEEVSNKAFPYFTARRLSIGLTPVLALRLSYIGELGWELYAPAEYSLKLWDTLWEAGQSLGILALGGGAFDSLRLEKGYRLWGTDIHTEYTPWEAGLGGLVRFDKGDFLGRAALLRLKEQGLSRKLCCLTLDDPAAVVLGKEPILDGQRALGYVTSANYGYTVGRCIAYGYLPLSHAEIGTKVEIEYFGRRYQATVQKEPLYDPKGERLRC